MLENQILGSFNLNNSEKHKSFPGDLFFNTRHLCQKMNPPSAVLGGGGVQSTVRWLIAYSIYMQREHDDTI